MVRGLCDKCASSQLTISTTRSAAPLELTPQKVSNPRSRSRHQLQNLVRWGANSSRQSPPTTPTKVARPWANSPCGTESTAPGSVGSTSSKCSGHAGLLRPIRLVVAGPTFGDLLEGPYVGVGLFLDARSLCATDAVCRRARQLNGTNNGPWSTCGRDSFTGVELDGEGVFEAPAKGAQHAIVSTMTNWKERYARFQQQLPTFREPYIGREIKNITQMDEVVYFRCMLRADAVPANSRRGIYLEVQVTANPDNLSLALVDFEGGGTSSVTFSPDTGAVIRERKVAETPRKVKGSYTQPLPAAPPSSCFRGAIGIYMLDGHLAFLRRCAGEPGTPARPWETTGFITDLTWAAGHCLTPCLAFREMGAYAVRVSEVTTTPPMDLGPVPHAAVQAMHWSDLDWDAEIDGV